MFRVGGGDPADEPGSLGFKGAGWRVGGKTLSPLVERDWKSGGFNERMQAKRKKR